MSHLGERLSALIDSELNHTQRERVLAHLARCEPCRREAVALRALKRRMLALGEASVTSNLADRLIALSALAGPIGPPAARRRWPAGGRRNQPGLTRGQWAVRSLAGAALAVLGLAIPAAFMAGGNQREPGPSVTPAVDVFIVQHVITTGEVPAQAPSAAASVGSQGATGTGPAGAGPAATAVSVPPATNASAGPARHPNGPGTHPGRSLSPPARCGIGGATVRRSLGITAARCTLGAPRVRHAAGKASLTGSRAR